MNPGKSRRATQALFNGMLLPFPGRKSMARQIQLEVENGSDPRIMRSFVIGHMLLAYPAVISLGLTVYLTIEFLSR